MLRAVLLAFGLLAAALGAYLYWLHRTQAYLHLRSLTAPPVHHASEARTRVLHVPGCQRDFIVKVGELVEPQITPSSSPNDLALAEKLYGAAHRIRHSPAMVWEQNAFTLTEWPPETLQLALNTGHVVQTLDGIELGVDSFNAIRARMRDHNLPFKDELVHGNQSWTYRLTIPSSCGPAWRSIYERTLTETPELDAQIYPPAGSTDHSPRPAAFLNRLALEYTLQSASAPAAVLTEEARKATRMKK